MSDINTEIVQARIDAESGAGNETKQVPAKRPKKLKADEAQAGIAAAMQKAIPEESPQTPAAFAIDQHVRVTTNMERLRVKHHSYAGKTGVIIRSWEEATSEWVVKLSNREKRIFLAKELGKV